MKVAEMKTPEKASMVAIRSVLFATDFSDAAKRGQTYATHLANRFGAKLFVVHANEPPNYGLRPETWRAANEASAAEMRNLRESLAASFPGLEHQFCVSEGTAWQAVESVLEENKIDLIVLGTRGRTGLGKLLLGSQAEEILRRAPCPVLTVGPNAQLMTGKENELNEVLYATDFSPESRMAAPYAVSMALKLQAHLNLLHVIEEPKVGELVRAEEVNASSERLLRSLVPDQVKFWREPRFFVERGESAERILEVAARTHAGLIVLGVRKPSGVPGAATHLGIGVAHKVVSAATCPVLTVRG
ncbi:MAG TPA: universal stress protein [Candidatus Bathyarchaeia archaeon]|nr:universal stress protein [Candidatus Bathyarchaeia archaeon]